MDIRNPAHNNEGQVMQEPAHNRVNPAIVNMIHIHRLKLQIPTLPPNRVPSNQQREDAERGRGPPVHERIAEQEVLDRIIVPAAHPQADVQNRPLPELGREVILLIRIGHERVIRRHHRDVEMDEVAQERRPVAARVAGGEFLVPVRLDVPVRVRVARVVVLGAGHFDLLEAPLRQVPVAGAQVAAEVRVLEAEGCGQRADLAVVARGGVVDDFDLPVVLGVADGRVAVA